MVFHCSHVKENMGHLQEQSRLEKEKAGSNWNNLFFCTLSEREINYEKVTWTEICHSQQAGVEDWWS